MINYRQELEVRGIKFSDVQRMAIKAGMDVGNDVIYQYLRTNLEPKAKYKGNECVSKQLKEIVEEMLHNHDMMIGLLQNKIAKLNEQTGD